MKTYDELYVISDIHLGGERNDTGNFQIFNHGERLGNFIAHVAAIRPDDDIALVLNGDIIDSLAEEDVPGYVALTEASALKMMNRIYDDPAFKPVWDGLEHFMSQPKRHLILVIGNHDIELALPVVEESIRQRLAGTNNDAQARIYFATHGGGFGCKVGNAKVFCTHGNEVDDWNWVNYNKLGQLANATNAGRIIDKSRWEPNAGTRMVIDIMNRVKKRYPFVDVLKPQVAAVAGILLALDKNILKQIDFTDAIPLARGKAKGRKVVSDLLGESASDSPTFSSEAVAREVADQLLGPSFKEAIEKTASEDELLLEAESSISGGDSPGGAAPDDEGPPDVLGIGDIFAGWVGLLSKSEALRRALIDWLAEDKSLDVKHKDDLYKKMQERVGDSVDFVVTGHTHKALALPMERSGFYYNCGTWIRILRLSSESLEDPAAFEKVIWPVLSTGDMAALDNAKIPGPGGKQVPLFFDRTTAVRISSKTNQAVGDLLRVSGGVSGTPIKVDKEPGTKSHKV